MQGAAWDIEMRMRRNRCGYWRTISNCATHIMRSSSLEIDRERSSTLQARAEAPSASEGQACPIRAGS